ncbi:hypothetical protein ACP4OV_020145 [Aristida adscensionis]
MDTDTDPVSSATAAARRSPASRPDSIRYDHIISYPRERRPLNQSPYRALVAAAIYSAPGYKWRRPAIACRGDHPPSPSRSIMDTPAQETRGRAGLCCRGSHLGDGGVDDGETLLVVGAAVAAVPAPEPYVMAVDDSSVDRAVITALLRRSQYRVTAVDSVKKALETLGTKPNVRMIITDYSMPEMTGYDLLKRVKESSELKKIPVVIMSSENLPTRIDRCLEEGAEDFLLKPVGPSDISRISARMLQST